MTLPVADRRPAESYLKLPAALQWNNNQLVQCSSATDKPHQSQREKEMERNGRKTGDSASGTECIAANIRRKWLQLLWHHTFIFRFFWCEILNSVCSYYANHKKTWGAL